MTVQAERLNFLRFLSHFRAVHRGASFAGLRTTSVRKLLPEYVVFLSAAQLLYFHGKSLLSFHSYFCGTSHYFSDLGVSFVLFTHLMGSHVGCLII